jgi:hypothetical protein
MRLVFYILTKKKREKAIQPIITRDVWFRVNNGHGYRFKRKSLEA